MPSIANIISISISLYFPNFHQVEPTERVTKLKISYKSNSFLIWSPPTRITFTGVVKMLDIYIKDDMIVKGPLQFNYLLLLFLVSPITFNPHNLLSSPPLALFPLPSVCLIPLFFEEFREKTED